MFSKEQLGQLLSEGKSLTDLLNMALETPRPATGASPLLQRAALVRWFDRALYESVLVEGLPGAPDWESFIESEEVERLASRQPRYAVRDAVARGMLEAWKQQPGEAQRFSSRLAEYFSADPVERFTHLVLANPAEAEREFLRLYREADEVFDLARCDMLLRALRHRNGLFPSLIPQTLRDALNDREQYYRSRSLFAEDYWRTVEFVERPSLVRHFEEWQADPSRWVLHFYGQGGFGKSMFVRWLVARRCVKEIGGRRIAVARLDSDHLDLPSLSRWPWLALLPVAEQLEVQLPNSPFLSLLHSFGDFAALLHRPSNAGRDGSRTSLLKRLKPEVEMLADQIPKLFQSGLGQSKAIIVLDTVEELLLHRRSGLQAMLEHSALLREKCSGLKVLLSGRYNLADPAWLPEFMKRHCREEDRLLIEGFEPDESEHYLRGLRRLPPQIPVEAIVRKTRGNPFELALFADLAIADPDLNTADVESYPEGEYARLIERIIDRMPPVQAGVAWLLRYAALPRQLTLEFVHEVLSAFLPGETDLARAWADLRRYAGDHAWVELKGDVLTLQPELRVPMRQRLRENALTPVIHEAAARYFEKCASQDEALWARCTAEGLYHRFHLEGLEAARRWREALEAPQAKDPAVRARLAEVPLSGDFVDDSGHPVKYPGGPLVDYHLLSEASGIQAWVLLEERMRARSMEASAGRLEGEFNDAWRRFQLFRERAAAADPPAPHALILEAAQLLFSDYGAEGERLLRRAVRMEEDPAALVVLEYMLGRCVFPQRPEEADAWFAAATRRAARFADPPLAPEWIEYRRARRLEDRGELERALACYQEAWCRIVPETAPDFAPDVLAGACRTLRALGSWREAERLARSNKARAIARTNARMQCEIDHARVHLALDRQNPKLALERLPANEDGATLLLRALAHRAALQVAPAEERFNQARDALVREGSASGPLDAVLQKAALFLEALGNVHHARETLLSVMPREGKDAPDRAVLEARILTASGKGEAAAARLRQALENKSAPRERLRLLACLAGLGLANEAEVLESLERLVRLRKEARYPFLTAFRFSWPWLAAAEHFELRGEFLAAVPAPVRNEADFELRAWLWGLAAPTFDCSLEAQDVLMTAWTASRRQPHFRRLLRGALRGAGVLRLPDSASYLASYEEAYGRQPELWGTALLEEAEYAMAEDPERAAIFEQAVPLLELCFPGHSYWAARRHELRARLAAQAGEDREALNALLTAHRAALESGVAVTARRLASEIEAYRNIAEQTHRDADLLPPATTIYLEPEAFPDRYTPAISSSRSHAAELVETLAYGREGFLNELRAALAPFATPLPDEYVELRTARGPLASLPWEAAMFLQPGQCVYRRPNEPVPLRDTVLMLQEAIWRAGKSIVVDGIYGPQTDGLLKEFASDPREARRRLLTDFPAGDAQVLVVQRGVEEDRFVKRSHGNYGVDLPAAYERAGLDVFRLADPRQLTTAVSRFRPSLLHLVSGFQESTRTGEVYLDFGDREAVSPSALDGLLRRVSGTGLHPFVLVEAILPADPYDQARQALLRNAFCDELFRFGNTRGVLAAGLTEPEFLQAAVEKMAYASAGRRFAADLYRDLALLPMLAPPALFTLDPEIPVLW